MYVCIILFLQVISAKALISHSGGLSGLYGDILQFIPDRCSLVLELTHVSPDYNAQEQDAVVKGFNFLVKSVWSEVVALIEKKLSVIFAPGNPDTFHKVWSNFIMLNCLCANLCELRL